MKKLRIMVVDDNCYWRDFICDCLKEGGHEVIPQAGKGMIESVKLHVPDMLVLDTNLSDLDKINITPVVVVTGDRETAVEERFLGYLFKPVEPLQLRTTVNVAWNCFQKHQALIKQNADLTNALEARKAIERAKGMLIKRYRWNEDDAFRYLQKRAMDERRRMLDIANDVIQGRT